MRCRALLSVFAPTSPCNGVPTLPPLQFALIHWVQGGGGDYTDITRAVVAEPSTDGVTYSRITNDTLAAITRGGCETSIIGAGG